jgi:ribosomal-protein-alanine N-acetyltransferase
VILADIRFCGKDDVDQVLAVDRTSPHPWPESTVVRDLHLGDSGVSYIGAFATADEKFLLGYAAVGNENGDGLLMNLVVIPPYQRRGIGAQLVVAAAEFVSELGFLKLALRVRMTNYAAMALYRGLGFRCDATRDGYYSDGGVAGYMSVGLPLILR